MFISYLKIALRSFAKNKLHIVINVAGLSIALACCIGGYFNWKFKNTWDENHVNGDKIYRVQFWHNNDGEQERYGISPLPLGEHIKYNIKEAESVVRYLSYSNDIRIGTELFNTRIAYADSAFFELFTFELIHGILTDFHDKSKIFISDELAREYFNRTDVVGQEIEQINSGVAKTFTIGGVFKPQPMNSSFNPDAIALYENLQSVWGKDLNQNWGEWNTLFLKVGNSANVSLIEKQLERYVEPQNRARLDLKISKYYLENFKGMANRNLEAPIIQSHQLRYGIPPEAVFIPGFTSVLLWLLACFNFTNTSIAISNRRLKELGVRKSLGAERKQLVLQFFGENFLICLISLFAALVLAEFLIPAYNNLWPFLKLELNYSQNIGFLFFIVGLLFLTAGIAGSYPACYISSFEPVSILKDKIKLSGTNWFNRVLLALTFTISMLAIIFAIGFYNNAKYQERLDFGYSTSGVLSVELITPNDFDVFKNKLLEDDRYNLQIAGTKNHIVTSIYNQSIKHEAEEKIVEVLDVGEGYLETIGIEIVSGRPFQSNSETDRNESIIITEEFAKQFRWNNNSAIGKRILWNDSTQLFVVGVAKDILTHALFEPVSPVMMRFIDRRDYREAVINSGDADMGDVEKHVRGKWLETFRDKPFNVTRNDIVRASANRVNSNGVKIVGCLGVIALLMSVTGLYTMVSLNITKRTKEIGIRKVMGASKWNIMKIVNTEFIIVLAIAGIVGGVLGKTLIDSVMGTLWVYYLKLQVLPLVMSIFAMLLLAGMILGIKTNRTSSENPTKTIRIE